MTPLVSCIVPTYQDAPMAVRCVEALLRQTYPALEIVVTDDSRNDAVEDAILSLWGDESRVRYRRGARTGNPVENWNLGLDHAQGAYLAVVHHDEFVVDDRYIEDAVAALERTGRRAFIGGVRVGGATRRTAFRWMRLASRVVFPPLWTLYVVNWIGPTASVVFRRREGLRFNPSVMWLSDVDFYVRLLRDRRDAVWSDRVHILSIAHGAQITGTLDRGRAATAEIARLRGQGGPFPRGRLGDLIVFLVASLAAWRAALARS